MSVQERIIEMIKETLKFEDKEITLQTNLYEDLGVDSLDAVELIMAIEDEYGVEVPDEELSNMNIVGNIVKYVEANKEA